MLQKTIVFLTVFSAALALFVGQAEAQTSRLYFSGYLGLNLFSDQDFSESTSGTSGHMEFKNTPSFAGALGLRFSKHLRLEAEISYTDADMDRINFEGGAGDFELRGNIDSTIALLNVYYDFEVPWSIQPFIGAGLGIGWFDGEIDDVSGLAADTSDSTIGLAYQLGGGLKYRVDPDLAFTGSYRYMGAGDLEFGGYEIDYGGHEFRIGLEYDLPVN